MRCPRGCGSLLVRHYGVLTCLHCGRLEAAPGADVLADVDKSRRGRKVPKPRGWAL